MWTLKGIIIIIIIQQCSLSPILTGFGKSFVDNSCGTVGSRHQGAVTCASSCLAFACRQLVQLTEKVWKAWLFLHVPNFIIPSCLWKSLFTSASLRDLMCEVYPHYQSRYTCRGLTDWQLSGLWVVCRAVEKRLFWDQHSDLWYCLHLSYDALSITSPSLSNPQPPLSCRPFSLLFYFCLQKAAAGCQSGRTVLRCFCGHAGK